MTSVLDAIVKLPRYVRGLSTNGIDENNAVVLDSDKDKDKSKSKEYYAKNRERLLGHKKKWADNPKNKDHIAQYHKNYYLLHKEQISLKQKERYNENKNKDKEKAGN